MGTSYLFVCDKCKYHAEVSGGEDCGFHIKSHTMTCNDCRSLVDVSIEYHAHLAEMAKDNHFDIDFGACPKCKGFNVRKWDNPGPCPKCSGTMIQKHAVCNWD